MHMNQKWPKCLSAYFTRQDTITSHNLIAFILFVVVLKLKIAM